MTRRLALTTFAAVQCLIVGLAATAPAQAAGIPRYFFKEWTITSNCTEANAGLAARVQPGLKFRSEELPPTAGFQLEALDAGHQQWASAWNGLKLEYRPGTKLTSVPADFECTPGAESTSPFLAMSGYVQSAEPYYEPEHLYGLVTINGQLEHVLIFPRDVDGDKSAIIVLQSASAPTDIQLDSNGVIISRN